MVPSSMDWPKRGMLKNCAKVDGLQKEMRDISPRISVYPPSDPFTSLLDANKMRSRSFTGRINCQVRPNHAFVSGLNQLARIKIEIRVPIGKNTSPRIA